jgi:hypothetical protein
MKGVWVMTSKLRSSVSLFFVAVLLAGALFVGAGGGSVAHASCWSYPVKKQDFTNLGRVVFTVSVLYSPDCNAYSGQMDSYSVTHNMSVTIRRLDNSAMLGSGWQNAWTVRTGLVPKGSIEVDGCTTDFGYRCYSVFS